MAIVLVMILGLTGSALAQTDSDTILAAEGISLTIDFGNGTINEYNNLNGTNVLEVTSSVLDVEVEWSGTLAYIKGIEGLIGEGEYGWQYWVNDEFASVAVNFYSLEDGDTVLWKYSSPNPTIQQDPTFIPGVIITAASGFGFITIVYIQSTRRIR